MRALCFALLLAVSFGGCKDPYFPTYEPEDVAAILIVEGYIDINGLSSQYTLGYAQPLADSLEEQAVNIPVANATLTVESEMGALYHSEPGSAAGAYIIPHPILPIDTRYRLRIRVGQDEYLSDFVEPKQSPEITSIDWERAPDGLQLFVSTEDPDNDSHYYRWEFEETWRFSAKYISQVILEDGEFRHRENDEVISLCFRSERSHDLLVGATVGLDADMIHRQPIHLIPNRSEKLQYRYSILVKQRAISAEAFRYWNIIKQNSEDLGDIFSPLPSEIRGNIRHVQDDQKKVVGLIEASGVTEKRIYIDPAQLPSVWLVENHFYQGCDLLENTTELARAFLMSNPNYIPIYGDARNPASPYPTHYAYAPRRCVDCTLRGTLDPPEFWEE